MLSAQQFAELIALIETSRPEEGPKPEVRRAQRIVHPCRISITIGNSENAGPSHLVQLKDISARGLCLLHNVHLSAGTSFVVKLQSPDGKGVSILSNVVHSKQLDEHTFQIGAEFTCAIGNEVELTWEHAPEDLMRIRSSILD